MFTSVRTKSVHGVVLSFLFCALFLVSAYSADALDLPATGQISVYFSPHGGTTEAIVGAIESARSQILVQAYSFTSVPIAKALVDAHNRGVAIEVILDKSQQSEKYSAADFLANMGIPTYIDSEHPIAHNKIMCIDQNVLITGSFNFTRQGEANAENCLILRKNPQLVKVYIDNFYVHRQHSHPYKGRADAAHRDDERKKSPSWRSLFGSFLKR